MTIPLPLHLPSFHLFPNFHVPKILPQTLHPLWLPVLQAGLVVMRMCVFVFQHVCVVWGFTPQGSEMMECVQRQSDTPGINTPTHTNTLTLPCLPAYWSVCESVCRWTLIGPQGPVERRANVIPDLSNTHTFQKLKQMPTRAEADWLWVLTCGWVKCDCMLLIHQCVGWVISVLTPHSCSRCPHSPLTKQLPLFRVHPSRFHVTWKWLAQSDPASGWYWGVFELLKWSCRMKTSQGQRTKT